MGQQYSHLSSEERILIEKLHCDVLLQCLFDRFGSVFP